MDVSGGGDDGTSGSLLVESTSVDSSTDDESFVMVGHTLLETHSEDDAVVEESGGQEKSLNESAKNMDNDLVGDESIAERDDKDDVPTFAGSSTLPPRLDVINLTKETKIDNKGESGKQTTCIVACCHQTTAFTGDDLLLQLKQRRKRETRQNGFWGGILGFVLFGPVGAAAMGTGSVLTTEHVMKEREKALKSKLKGRLNEPIPNVARQLRYKDCCY